jgi:tetratricopeptide (TPR) repeat protein
MSRVLLQLLRWPLRAPDTSCNTIMLKIQVVTRAIEIREALRRSGLLVEPNDLARNYVNRAICHKRNNSSEAALDYSNAIEIRESLLREGKEYLIESLIDIHLHRAALDTDNGFLERALASNSRAIELTEDLVSNGQIVQREKLAKLYSQTVKPLAAMGEHDRAIESHNRAIELLDGLYRERKLNDLLLLIRQKQDYAAILAVRGRIGDAIVNLGEVVDLCELEGDAPSAAKTLNQRGYLLMEMSRLEEALGDFERAIEICRRLLINKDIGSSTNLAAALHSKAECLEKFGQFEESLKLCEDGKSLLEHCKNTGTSSWAKQIRSELEALQTKCELDLSTPR